MILVTGATGLLGAHILAALTGTTKRIAALIRPAGNQDVVREVFSYYHKNPEEALARIEWRTGNLLKPDSLSGLFSGIRIVVNCAATVSFDPRERKKLIRENVAITRNLIDAWASTGLGFDQDNVDAENERNLLIHVSSTSALGDAPGNDPGFFVDEETPRNPGLIHTGYSVSKYESENLVWEAAGKGLGVFIINPGIILGPGQWNRGSSLLFSEAWKGLKFFPYGGTGYVDVRDVCQIIFKGISNWEKGIREGREERYCVVGFNMRYKEFFDRVTDEFGKPNPVIYAGRFLTGLAWRMDMFRARFTGKPPVITRETARSSRRISYYSSKKIRKTLDFEFRPASETLAWICDIYKKKMNVM